MPHAPRAPHDLAHDAVALLGHPRELIEGGQRRRTKTQERDVQASRNRGEPGAVIDEFVMGFVHALALPTRHLYLAAGFERDRCVAFSQRDPRLLS
jgi:hypothetical protein